MSMRNKTAENVATLLSSVEILLSTQQGGRPRMLPGYGWRPAATNSLGKLCSPTHFRALRFSLVGALKHEAKYLGFNAYERKLAAWAILDASSSWCGGDSSDLSDLDASIYDTRAIVRLVHKARRTVEKGIKATELTTAAIPAQAAA